jgi:hypothetical protein
VRVRVENGTGRAGLGRAAAAALADAGFSVPAAATDAASRDHPTSLVRYGPDKADSARTLAAAVPDAVLREDDTLGGTLVLVLGDTFDGVRAPGRGEPSRQTPAPAASATSPERNAADAGCVN